MNERDKILTWTFLNELVICSDVATCLCIEYNRDDGYLGCDRSRNSPDWRRLCNNRGLIGADYACIMHGATHQNAAPPVWH